MEQGQLRPDASESGVQRIEVEQRAVLPDCEIYLLAAKVVGSGGGSGAACACHHRGDDEPGEHDGERCERPLPQPAHGAGR
jgi:hypothetical protein